MKHKIPLTVIITTLIILVTATINHTDTITVQSKTDSPESTLYTFWESAFFGNQNTLNAISFTPNENWIGNCIEKSKADSDKLIDRISTININEENYDKQPKSASNKNKENVEVSFEGNNVPSNVRIFARYIYGSKVKWHRFKIIDNKSINDETLLMIQVAEYPNNFDNSEKFAVGFKKINSEWKIIGVVQMNMFNFVDEQIHYGSFRPNCSEY